MFFTIFQIPRVRQTRKVLGPALSSGPDPTSYKVAKPMMRVKTSLIWHRAPVGDQGLGTNLNGGAQCEERGLTRSYVHHSLPEFFRVLTVG